MFLSWKPQKSVCFEILFMQFGLKFLIDWNCFISFYTNRKKYLSICYKNGFIWLQLLLVCSLKNYFNSMHFALIMQMSSFFDKNDSNFGKYQSSILVIFNFCNMKEEVLVWFELKKGRASLTFFLPWAYFSGLLILYMSMIL